MRNRIAWMIRDNGYGAVFSIAGIRVAFLILGLGLNFFVSMGLPPVDSLRSLIPHTPSGKLASLHNDIATALLPGNPSEAIPHASKALELATLEKNTRQQAIAKKNLGVAYYNQYDYNQSLANYSAALEFFQQAGDTVGLASVFNNMGLVFREKGEFEQAMEHHFKAAQLLAIIRDSTGLALAYNFLGSLAWRQKRYDDALEHYQLSLELRQAMRNEKEVAGSLNNIALVYRDAGQFDKALQYYTEALESREKQGDQVAVAITLNDMGGLYARARNYPKALEMYLQALKIRHELGVPGDIAAVYSNIGNVFRGLDNFDKALEYYRHALMNHELSGDKRKIALTHHVIGNLHLAKKDNDKALESYQKSLVLRRETGELDAVAASLNNVGMVYAARDQFSKALIAFLEALSIREKLADKLGQAEVLNNLGNLSDQTGDKQGALNYYERAFSIASGIPDHYHMALVTRKMGDIWLERGNATKAESLFKQSLDMARQSGGLEAISMAWHSLYRLEEVKGDKGKALEYFKNFVSFRDSIQRAKTDKHVRDLQVAIELAQKDQEVKKYEFEVDKLRQEKEIQRLELGRQKNIRNIALLVIVFVLTLTVVLYRYYSDKKKVNRVLADKNTQLEDMNMELAKSECELTRLNTTKDKFLSIIAHDIKNPLVGLMHFSEIIVDQVNVLEKDQILEFSKIIHESSKNVYNLLENLLYWSRSNSGRIDFRPEKTDLSSIVRSIFLLLRINAGQKSIALESSISTGTFVFVDQNMVTTIIRNLVSNAIKFTPDGGRVMLTALPGEQWITVSVTDTGIGISNEVREKMFKEKTYFTTVGTSNEAGTGLGLILCKEFVSRHKGDIFVESEPGLGSTFLFTLPLYIES